MGAKGGSSPESVEVGKPFFQIECGMDGAGMQT